MKKDYTHVAFLLDRSGSMDKIKSDTIGGFNAFLKDQKKDGTKCTFTMVQFNHEYVELHNFEEIQEVNLLTKNTFCPSGSTSLLDALGQLIENTGETLSGMDEDDRPEKILFIILTDGEENTSERYNLDMISGMIKHQEEKYKWKFVYLGANQDAIKESSKYGISSVNTLNFAANEKGVDASYTTLSKVVTNSRGVDAQAFAGTCAIDDEDIAAQDEAMKPK